MTPCDSGDQSEVRAHVYYLSYSCGMDVCVITLAALPSSPAIAELPSHRTVVELRRTIAEAGLPNEEGVGPDTKPFVSS
jgi:hypothetical protein